MNNIKWIFILYAVLTAIFIMGIGVAIGVQSILGVIGCIIAVIVVMGLGFKAKAKMRTNKEL
jgi:high-affinity Fe2+/Pb2+ permease